MIKDYLHFPSVHLDEKDFLPESPGVYFVSSPSGVLVYIGRSENIQRRWANHNRWSSFSSLADKGLNLRIYFLVTHDYVLEEIKYINALMPLSNRETRVPRSDKKLIELQSKTIQTLAAENERLKRSIATKTNKLSPQTQVEQLVEQVAQLTAAVTLDKLRKDTETEKISEGERTSRYWANLSAIELWGGNLVDASGTLQPLRMVRSFGATEERIDRAVQAIMDRNDAIIKAKPDKKWAITNRLIRDLTGANGQAISARLTSTWQKAISYHHSKHNIEGEYHNRRYHGGLGEKALAQKAAVTFWPYILDLNK